ncbi:MAG TPA: dihydrofolate reductase family protein, partial [Rubrivivax sp.]|nr:dihydrofolate reductase family protein [Rubrivivax sp.]
TARLLAPPGEALIYTTEDEGPGVEGLRAAGAALCGLRGEAGKLDLVAMIADLAARGINELHVEAGHRLNASLLRTGLVDELLVYLAPKLIGLGREMAAIGPLERLSDALPLRFESVQRIGEDLRVNALLPAGQAFVDTAPP